MSTQLDIINNLKQSLVPKIVLSLLICIFGLIGNTVAIFIIVVLKEYQKSITHWYILQLAVADSIFLLTIPFKVSEDINLGFIYPEWVCKARETILFLNYYSSILFLMVLSIDRYIAVCHSFSDSLQKLRKKSTVILITLVTWIVSLLLCIPVMIHSFKVGGDPHCRCLFEIPKEKNDTADCIQVGSSSPLDLEHCLNVSRNNPLPENGEKYCKIVGSTEYNNYYSSSNNTSSNNISDEYTDSYSSEYDEYASGYEPGTGLGSEGDHGTGSESNSGALVFDASCHYWNRGQAWINFLIYNFTVMFVLPLVVMILCYGLIVRRLSVAQMKQRNTPNTVSSSCVNQSTSATKRKIIRKRSTCRSDKDRRRVTIMSATLVACFLICWLPFHANHLAKIVGIKVENPSICEVLPVVGSLLAYLNSALNPYLYSFLGYSFVRKWNSVTSTVRKSIRKRRSTTSVQVNQSKQNREGSISTTGTLMTKIQNKSKKRNRYGFETRLSIDATIDNNSDERHSKSIPTVYN